MESDTGIVAEKPANKAVRAATERVEPRPVTNGNACGQSTGGHYADQTQCWRPPCHRRPHGYGEPLTCRQRPEVGAVCANAHVRICAGSAGQPASLPRKVIDSSLVGGVVAELHSFILSSMATFWRRPPSRFSRAPAGPIPRPEFLSARKRGRYADAPLRGGRNWTGAGAGCSEAIC